MSIREKVSAGKSALLLLLAWATILVLAWVFVLNKLISGGWFYGAP